MCWRHDWLIQSPRRQRPRWHVTCTLRSYIPTFPRKRHVHSRSEWEDFTDEQIPDLPYRKDPRDHRLHCEYRIQKTGHEAILFSFHRGWLQPASASFFFAGGCWRGEQHFILPDHEQWQRVRGSCILFSCCRHFPAKINEEVCLTAASRS